MKRVVGLAHFMVGLCLCIVTTTSLAAVENMPTTATATAPAVPTASAVPAVKGDPNRGQTLTQTCVACHGTDGNTNTPIWPKIAEQPEKYLIEQLKAFRLGNKGPRFDASMFAMTQSLSDQDINDLSAFYASQKSTLGKAQQNFVELGEKIYRGGNLETHVAACAACHGAKGDGNELAGFPRLSGQNSEYILAQLKKFKEGTRSNDPNGIMRDIAKKMSDSEMQAVSSYVSGLH